MAGHAGRLTAESPSTAPAVTVEHLVRGYGPKGVLNGVDLEIAPGEFVALLGPSGCGKSTLLRALAGIDSAVSGSGRIRVPEKVSVVFQDSRLLPWASLITNVTLGQRAAGARDAAARRSPRSDSADASRTGRTSCPAASSSESRWPGRWCATRRCCSPTSRSGRSTR